MTLFIAETASITSDENIPSSLVRELRRADSFIKYGALAAHKIFAEEPLRALLSDDCGLFIGSAFGPMETNFDVLAQVVTQEQTSPTLFSHSVFNAAAGYLARIFKLHGGALTITDFAFPFFQALQNAAAAIESNQISSCLVLQIETFSTLLMDAGNSFGNQDKPKWTPGACAWLLTSTALTEKAKKIDSLSLSNMPSKALHYLDFKEELDLNGKKRVLTGPLGAAIEISNFLNDSILERCSFSLSAPYGEVNLNTSIHRTS